MSISYEELCADQKSAIADLQEQVEFYKNRYEAVEARFNVQSMGMKNLQERFTQVQNTLDALELMHFELRDSYEELKDKYE